MERMSVYNIVGALDSIRDQHNDILTEEQRVALIVAANVVLGNKEAAKKELAKHTKVC